MQDNGKEVMELLHKLLGELQPPFLKNKAPAAERIGADLFEIAAAEIGVVVSARKKLKTIAKVLGTKMVRKQLGGEKRNLTVDFVKKKILEKLDRKTVALAKIF